MSHADPPPDFNPFTDPDTEFDAIFETVSPANGEPVLSADSESSRRRRLESAWGVSQGTAGELIDRAGLRFTRAARRVTDARRRTLAGLEPLVLYSAENLGNTRASTLLGLVYTLEADHSDRSVVDDSGSVAFGSTLYRVLDFLATQSDDGLREPEARFRAFLEDEGLKALWPVLRAALGGRPVGQAPNGDSEHSSLNFEVPASEGTSRPLKEVLAELDALNGLGPVKGVLREFTALEQANALRRDVGLRSATQSRHMLFLGNPGTGKTTVARLVADLLKACGTLPDARLVEVDRSMLIGEWLGSSAMKTRKVADAALGGVLFIDEAYSLAGSDNQGTGDRFAQEALDTLVKVMEDDRDDLVVILAGYPGPMQRLLRMNPGLASRIGLTVEFPDYGADELLDIFRSMAAAADYEVGDEALVPIAQVVRAAAHGDRFGNARFVRSLLEASIRAHSVRVMGAAASGETPIVRDLITLRLADTIRAARAVASTATGSADREPER